MASTSHTAPSTVAALPIHPEDAAQALPTSLTDAEWQTLLDRTARDPVDRAWQLLLFFPDITDAQVATLPFTDVVRAAWAANSSAAFQERLLAQPCIQTATFPDWARVMLVLVGLREHRNEPPVVRVALERMRALGTADDWMALVDALGPERWYSRANGYGFLYREAVTTLGRVGTTRAQLKEAFRRSTWTESEERSRLFRKLLRACKTFAETQDATSLMLSSECNSPVFSRDEYQRLVHLCYHRQSMQAVTFGERCSVASLSRSGRYRWRPQFLRDLVDRATTFDEVTRVLTSIGDAHDGADALAHTLEKLLSFPQPFDAWMTLGRRTGQRVVCIAALQRAIALATTPTELLEVLGWTVRANSPLHAHHEEIVTKLLRLSLTTAQWKEFLLAEKDAPEIRARIVAAMAAKPLDMERAYLLTVLASPGTPPHERGETFLNNPTRSFASWETLLAVDFDSFLFPEALAEFRQTNCLHAQRDLLHRTALVLGKMTGCARTKKQWERVHALATTAQDMETIARARAALAAFARKALGSTAQ
jgi:hypothetical protein